MENSKFIKSLQSLTKKQQTRYLEFVESPYFNHHEDVKRFVGMVLSGKTHLSQKTYFETMYPHTSYDGRRIQDLMHKSLKLLEEFLAEEQYAEQEWGRKMNILGHITKNGPDELRTVVETNITQLRERKPLRDSEYFYNEYQYQTEAYNLFLNQAKIQGEQALQTKMDVLDLFYLAAKLRDSCEMVNRNRILAKGYELHLLDHLLHAIREDFERYAAYPAVTIYYRIMLMLRNTDDAALFNDLKSEVRRHIQLFQQEEQRSLYGYLQNYCILKINSGHAEYYRELFDIYQYMMSTGLMDANNKNLQWDLKNMVSIALRLGEYDWAYQTINILKDRLAKDARDNAYTYNLANYYYETKEYKKATRLLQSVEFSEVYYNLDSKVMLLKIYFEQEEEEAFFSFVAAFQAYLTRNKLISKDNYVIYSNFVRFARQIFTHKTSLPYLQKKNSKKIIQLKNTIINTKQVANINWLTKEMDKLVAV